MISTIAILMTLIVGLRYLMPPKENNKEILLSKSKYRKLYFLSYLIWILSGLLLATLIYFIISIFRSNSSKEFLYDLYPDTSFWIGVSVISGLSMGIIVMFGLTKLLFKEEWNSFWATYDNSYRFRATSILKVLAIILGVIGVVFISLGNNSEFKIYPNKIKVSRLFELSSKEYKMDEIVKIINRTSFVAPNGNRVYKPHYEIVFKDGNIWNTRLDIRTPKESDKNIFKKISEYSGKLIEITN